MQKSHLRVAFLLSGKANMIASDASQLRCFMVEGMIEKTKKRLGRRFLIGFVAERAGFEPAVGISPHTLSRRAT